MKLRQATYYAIAQEARDRGITVTNEYDTKNLEAAIYAHAVANGG
jgi:predicted HTH domain antitoxin